MGSPPTQKKHYDTPRRPWDKEKLEADKELMQKYGLRRKQEIYRAETLVRQIRRRARKLFAERDAEKEKVLFKKTYDLGLTEENATLDKILELNIRNLLERRLQTLVWKKTLANTVVQSRQFITHGHIIVGGKKVTSPSYLVQRSEDGTVGYAVESTLNSKFKYDSSKKQKGKDDAKKPAKKDEEEKEVPPALEAKLPEAIEEAVTKV